MACQILIVEDDPELREMMAQLLALEGFLPEVAGNGREALDKLRGGARPHLILLDMMVPVMDGWTFCVHQRGDPAIAPIPIVILSAAPAESLREVSAAAIVRKPFDYDSMLSTIRAHC